MPLIMTISDSEPEDAGEDSDLEMQGSSKIQVGDNGFEFAQDTEWDVKDKSTAQRRLAINQKIQRRIQINEKQAARRLKMQALARANANNDEESANNDEESDNEDDDAEESPNDDDDEGSSDESDETTADVSQTKVSRKKKKKAKKEVTVDFADLKLSRPLLRAVQELGFKKPTPVQAKAIPIALTGRDLLVNAMTGSGKTAAFMLPVLERLIYRPPVAQTRVLVLVPTRELAAQVYDMTLKLAKFTDVTAVLVVGGLSHQEQATNLRSHPDIVVATPGRLIDHLHNTLSFAIEHVEILILDEADRLLESGFSDELKEIIRMAPRGRQSMLFSATLDQKVDQLVSLSLNQPQLISIDPYSSVVDNLAQEFIRIRGSIGKTGKGEDKALELRRQAITLALCKRSFKKRVIVFVKSKVAAHRLLLVFGLAKIRVGELHGNMTQAQRLEALELFKSREVDVLVCTDLAARGLDIDGVATVINMHLPRELRLYIHRVGRTARAGRSGRSISLAGPNDRKLLRAAVKKSKDAVKSRQLAEKVVKRYSNIIMEMEEDIQEILLEESEEKKMRIAEMEANKARNMLVHEDEIAHRPAREWFQTPKERQASKDSAVRQYGTADEEEEEKDKKKKKGRKKKEKPLSREAQLRGLSRREKRRKMAMWEEEEWRAEQKANPEPTEKFGPMPSIAQKAGKNVKPKEAGRKKGLGKKVKKSYALDEVGAQSRSSRFADSAKKAQRQEAKEKEIQQAKEQKKKRKLSGSGAFKSKSRYKRKR